jgi:hypothetical protein
MTDDNDPLRAASGIVNAVLIGAAFWLVLFYLF